jgi:hypothetical protein
VRSVLLRSSAAVSARRNIRRASRAPRQTERLLDMVQRDPTPGIRDISPSVERRRCYRRRWSRQRARAAAAH